MAGTGRRGEYHHGNLRAALLDAAASEIAEVGCAAMSLRRVAARVGVTHPAAGHHFGDKTGLLTALAAEGHRMLAADMAATRDAGGGLLELGVTYLRFALERRPWFDVMYRPELLRRDDPELVEARRTSAALLGATAEALVPDSGRDVAMGAWSIVHGFATLHLAGNLPSSTPSEAEALFRAAASAFAGVGRRGPAPG